MLKIAICDDVSADLRRITALTTAASALPAQQRALRFTAVKTGQLIMELCNPYNNEVVLDENGLPVSNKESHGKGTQSVADFVKQSGRQY